MRKKKKGQTESIKDVWDAQSHSKEEKREFYQEHIGKYRASGDMQLVSYYVTLYASTKPKVEQKEVRKIALERKMMSSVESFEIAIGHLQELLEGRNENG